MSLFETIAATLLSFLMMWFGGGGGGSVNQVSVASSTVAEVVAVIDGDTIIVSLAGREETVRYIGIDTPEPRREAVPECGSHEATEYNRVLVEGKSVRLVADIEDRDRFDRLLRYVYVGEGMAEIFVNKDLLRAGYARTLTIAPNTTYATDFKTLEQTAREARLGNWNMCQ